MIPTTRMAQVLAAAIFITACRDNPLSPIDSVPAEVTSASTQIAVASISLRLTSHLWRDFQPGALDTSLRASLNVQTTSGAALPAGITVEAAWLFLDGEVWRSRPTQSGTTTLSSLSLISRNGPKWAVGAEVIAVVQIRDAANNSYFLRSAPEKIVRTD